MTLRCIGYDSNGNFKYEDIDMPACLPDEIANIRDEIFDRVCNLSTHGPGHSETNQQTIKKIEKLIFECIDYGRTIAQKL